MRETFQREKNHQRFDLPSFHFSSSIVFYEKFFSLSALFSFWVCLFFFFSECDRKKEGAPP